MNKNAKECFSKALQELMVKEDIDRITVKDICDRAGFPRETFYYHYRDKEDFLEKGSPNRSLDFLDDSKVKTPQKTTFTKESTKSSARAP